MKNQQATLKSSQTQISNNALEARSPNHEHSVQKKALTLLQVLFGWGRGGVVLSLGFQPELNSLVWMKKVWLWSVYDEPNINGSWSRKESNIFRKLQLANGLNQDSKRTNCNNPSTIQVLNGGWVDAIPKFSETAWNEHMPRPCLSAQIHGRPSNSLLANKPLAHIASVKKNTSSNKKANIIQVFERKSTY